MCESPGQTGGSLGLFPLEPHKALYVGKIPATDDPALASVRTLMKAEALGGARGARTLVLVTPQESLEKRGPILQAVLWGVRDVTDTTLQEARESSMSLQGHLRSSSPRGVPRPPVNCFRRPNLPAHSRARLNSGSFCSFQSSWYQDLIFENTSHVTLTYGEQV